MNLALPHGTILDDFQVHDELNRGGFSIIYEGSNRESKTPVAIKEYLPDGLATRDAGGRYIQVVPKKERDFQEGLEDFLNEANILEQLSGHDNIVCFYKKIEMHNTAYIVMELVGGKDLSTHLKDEGGILGENELKAILYPLLNALEAVHKAGYLHRDIKPGNIGLRREDRSPVLLDFGAAQKKGMNQKVMVTDPYSPPEQYAARKQEPSTDIYALGAVCFQALMGILPEAGNQREHGHDTLHDTFYVEGVSEEFHKAIDKALKVEPSKRPQNVEKWKEMMEQSSSESGQKEATNEVPPTKSLGKPPVPPNPLKLFDRLNKHLSKLSDRLIVGIIILCIVGIIGITYWDNIDWEEPPPSPPPPLGYEALTKKEAELKKFRAEVGKDVEPHPRGEHGGRLHLHITANRKLPMLTKDLIDEGADVDKKNKAGWTALHYAAVANAAEVVEVLIDGGADFHAKDIALGQTPLHYAANWGSVEAARALLKKGADVLKRDESGLTPLHCVGDNAVLVKMLLDWKADVHAKAKNGLTPLHLAAWRNDSEAVRALLIGGAKVHATDNDGNTPLLWAAQYNASEAVRELLNGRADPNVTDNDGNTPLHWVAQHNASEAVEALLNEGAKIHVTDNEGNTPLRLAARHNASEAVKELLNRGAKVYATDNEGNTPLHTAAQSNASEAVRALLNGRANPNTTAKNGLTPLHWAAWHNASEAVRVLIAEGANVNATDNDGNTPLHTAAERGSPEVVEKLLRWRRLRKLDIKAKNNDDKTALDLASSPRVKELLKPLFESSEMQ